MQEAIEIMRPYFRDGREKNATFIPNLLLLTMGRLGLKSNEQALILFVWSEWSSPDRLPAPSRARLAAMYGSTPRQVSNVISDLEGRGFLRVFPVYEWHGGRSANAIDLSPLMLKAESLRASTVGG